MTRMKRRAHRRALWRGGLMAFLLVLPFGVPAAAGSSQSLSLSVSAGARIGSERVYTANVGRLSADIQDVVLYEGSGADAVPLANQTCVRAPGASWECLFTLTSKERSGTASVFALAFRPSVLQTPMAADAASGSVRVEGSAAAPAAPLAQILPIAFLGVLLAGFRIVQQHKVRF
ncbi:MAG: hypothetical protein M0Z66_04895 [Thermaerobacter sp.]|nr:hypothetical protein [Thermaerobacter sp.]